MDDKALKREELRRELEGAHLAHVSDPATIGLIVDMCAEAMELDCSVADTPAGKSARAALRGELLEAMRPRS